jgi:hypothetical protein
MPAASSCFQRDDRRFAALLEGRRGFRHKTLVRRLKLPLSNEGFQDVDAN